MSSTPDPASESSGTTTTTTTTTQPTPTPTSPTPVPSKLNWVERFILKLVAPEIRSIISQLQVNRDVNVAIITDQFHTVAGAVQMTTDAAVMSFIASVVRGNIFLTTVFGFLRPQLQEFITNLVDTGTSDIPTLYDKVVDFLEKEESYLP
jgi:hypothetical protein